jgi:hypothetical protein
MGEAGLAAHPTDSILALGNADAHWRALAVWVTVIEEQRFKNVFCSARARDASSVVSL